MRSTFQILAIVEADVNPHVVARQLIALSDGQNTRPVLGMFLGGAGLAEGILFCRNKIYPLGLPNWLSHLITVFALFQSNCPEHDVAFGVPPRRHKAVDGDDFACVK